MMKLPSSLDTVWHRGLVLVCLLLPWLSPFAPGPSPSVFPSLLSVICAAVLLAMAKRIRTDDIMFIWLVAALASCVIAFCQYFNVARYMAPWLNVASPGEAFANLRQRNQFASLTNIGLLALLWWVSMANTPSRHRVVSLIILLAAGNAISASRTGFVQLLLVILLVGFWRGPLYREKLCLALLAGFSYLASVCIFPPLLKWFTGVEVLSAFDRLNGASNCNSRMVLWSNVMELIRTKPWFGWGWGELDFAHYMYLYPRTRFCDILDNAHNLPLHIAVALGIPAALAFIGIVWWFIWLSKPWSEEDITRQTAWGVIAVLAVHSLLEYPLWYGPFQLSAIACIWLLRNFETHNAQAAFVPAAASDAVAREMPGKWQATRFAVAILLTVSSVYAIWDYHRISQLYLAPQDRDAAYRDDTLVKARHSLLFRSQVQFAELSLTPLVPGNAQWVYDTATSLLHYSPEPRIIEKTIESATMLGLDAEALAHLARYKAAFPVEAERWLRGNAATLKALSKAGS